MGFRPAALRGRFFLSFFQVLRSETCGWTLEFSFPSRDRCLLAWNDADLTQTVEVNQSASKLIGKWSWTEAISDWVRLPVLRQIVSSFPSMIALEISKSHMLLVKFFLLSSQSISKSFSKIYSLNYHLESHLSENHFSYLCLFQQLFYILFVV